MLAWDNTARRGPKAHIFENFSIDKYVEWLEASIEHRESKGQEPIVFINAWNEWGEGTYLEPDGHFKTGALSATNITNLSINTDTINRLVDNLESGDESARETIKQYIGMQKDMISALVSEAYMNTSMDEVVAEVSQQETELLESSGLKTMLKSSPSAVKLAKFAKAKYPSSYRKLLRVIDS